MPIYFVFWLLVAYEVIGCCVVNGFQARVSRRKSLLAAPAQIFLGSRSSSLAESFRESLESPSQNVVDSIAQSETSCRLTVGDCALLAGIPLVKAKRELMILSSITGSRIEVDENGELIYTFPIDFEKTLMRKNIRSKIQYWKNKASPPLIYLTKASFAVMLFTSLAIIAGTFVVASSSANSANEKKENKNNEYGRGNTINVSLNNNYMFRRSSFFNYFDLLYYQIKYGHSKMGYLENRTSFIESFFSFVFGDGNPNEIGVAHQSGFNFKERQLQYVLSTIRQQNGIVVAENLAPFLDPPSMLNQFNDDDITLSSAIIDEGWILPAVVQLNGETKVTPQGNIYYVFPEALPTTLEYIHPMKKDNENLEGENEIKKNIAIIEETVPFSCASKSQIAVASSLGGINFIGVAWIGRLLLSGQSGILKGSSPLFFTALSRCFPLLLGYSTLYIAFPIFRYSSLKNVNAKIMRKNDARRLWADLLNVQQTNKNSELKQKFKEKCQDVKLMGSKLDRKEIGEILFDSE